jgi:hypothetical protein
LLLLIGDSDIDSRKPKIRGDHDPRDEDVTHPRVSNVSLENSSDFASELLVQSFEASARHWSNGKKTSEGTGGFKRGLSC